MEWSVGWGGVVWVECGVGWCGGVVCSVVVWDVGWGGVEWCVRSGAERVGWAGMGWSGVMWCGLNSVMWYDGIV